MLKYSQLMENSEKEKYFVLRTQNHIRLVNFFYKFVKEQLPELPDDWDFSDHDEDKLREPLKTPYIEISWKYFKPDYVISEEQQKLCNEATLQHVKNNPHHPEYYDPENAEINPENRDKASGKGINAQEMPTKHLIEMVCDWAAVAWERGQKSPRNWAKQNIDVRWHFSKLQIRKIYMIILIIERLLEKESNNL